MPFRMRCLSSLLFALAAMLFVPGASAQDDQLSLRELKLRGRLIQGWVKAPISGANKDVFTQYFQRFYFPQMLKTDPEAVGELASTRTALFDRFILPAHPEVQRELTSTAYKFSMTVIGGKYPRPIKYNAMLILGNLDEDYGDRNGQGAKPLGEANLRLCQVVRLGVEKQSLPNYMHVGALVGLERHAQYLGNLDDRTKQRTQQVLLMAANQQKFRPGTSRDVQYWMRLQAAKALAATGSPGAGGVSVQAIAGLVADDQADLATRSAAASLLADIKMDGVPAEVTTQAVDAVKSLACGVCARELESADEFMELQSRRGFGMSSMATNPRFQVDEQGNYVYVRRGLTAQLEQLKQGLEAIAPVAGDDAPTISSIKSSVQSTIDVAGERNIDLAVVDSIRELHAEVSNAAGCDGGAEDDADADEDLLDAAIE